MFSWLRNTLNRMARTVLRGTMVVLVLLGLSSAAEARRSERMTVNDRIARIRETAREQAQAPTVEQAADEVQLAQWGNWGNWPNWGNWANWNNWGNWGNWGNWPNM
jgi:hypothetical protein